jgi:hypothetical protein
VGQDAALKLAYHPPARPNVGISFSLLRFLSSTIFPGYLLYLCCASVQRDELVHFAVDPSLLDIASVHFWYCPPTLPSVVLYVLYRALNNILMNFQRLVS